MSEDRVPLFVRLPRAQATALDDLADATGQRKQRLISDLLARQLDVGRIELRESKTDADEEVLTLEEASMLLRVSPEMVRSRALAGELPGRVLGEEWRFSRTALLAWLASTEPGSNSEKAGPGATIHADLGDPS